MNSLKAVTFTKFFQLKQSRKKSVIKKIIFRDAGTMQFILTGIHKIIKRKITLDINNIIYFTILANQTTDI